MEILQPKNWSRPKGFSHGVAAKGGTIFVSGMIGSDAQGKVVSGNFSAQVRQALHNILEVLAQAEAKPEHIVRMTWYLLDKKDGRLRESAVLPVRFVPMAGEGVRKQ